MSVVLAETDFKPIFFQGSWHEVGSNARGWLADCTGSAHHYQWNSQRRKMDVWIQCLHDNGEFRQMIRGAAVLSSAPSAFAGIFTFYYQTEAHDPTSEYDSAEMIVAATDYDNYAVLVYNLTDSQGRKRTLVTLLARQLRNAAVMVRLWLDIARRRNVDTTGMRIWSDRIADDANEALRADFVRGRSGDYYAYVPNDVALAWLDEVPAPSWPADTLQSRLEAEKGKFAMLIHVLRNDYPQHSNVAEFIDFDALPDRDDVKNRLLWFEVANRTLRNRIMRLQQTAQRNVGV